MSSAIALLHESAGTLKRRVAAWFSEDETTWVYAYANRVFGGHLIWAGAATGLGFWLIGLAFASKFGLDLYVDHAPFWLGAVGIGWVTFWGAYGDMTLRAALVQVEKAFAKGEGAGAIVADTRSELFSRRKHLLGGGVVVVATCIYAAVRVFVRHRLAYFPPGLSSRTDDVPKYITLVIYAIPIELLVLTMIHGAYHYLRLVAKLRKLGVEFPLELARYRLRPLTGWGVRCGLGWSLAVTTLIIFLKASNFVGPHTLLSNADAAIRGKATHRIEFDRGTIAGLTTLVLGGIWGPLLFGWPQIFFHAGLGRCRDVARSLVADEINGTERDQLSEYEKYVMDAVRSNETPTRRFAELSAQSTWVYGAPEDSLMFLGQALIPIVTLIGIN